MLLDRKIAALNLIGMKKGTFHPLFFFDQILSAELISKISKLFWGENWHQSDEDFSCFLSSCQLGLSFFGRDFWYFNFLSAMQKMKKQTRTRGCRTILFDYLCWEKQNKVCTSRNTRKQKFVFYFVVWQIDY